ncbi:Coiled-coil domain-containing protein 130 [Thelohanellus kitauei]|uniref:Coiled-coil domain-containing protein 130 n=1 Tax=Thelohanellus kitauei TaxID=669202 RepID=A0A0C2IS38_THEKT|nr:Coiled-coil domain-containing protein 130 [Thelohanellus kitauei]
MSERKAVNKYYPPEWRPEMGSINYYRKSLKFRERPKDQEERDPVFVIRFEMPFNIWCNGCNQHVGMGVRYNAQKKSIGKYFTTPMYKFRMKCHLCDNHFEIRTDPQNNDYVILSGARRKEERWDPKDSGAIELTG